VENIMSLSLREWGELAKLQHAARESLRQFEGKIADLVLRHKDEADVRAILMDQLLPQIDNAVSALTRFDCDVQSEWTGGDSWAWYPPRFTGDRTRFSQQEVEQLRRG
jgi:hypothetical protein